MIHRKLEGRWMRTGFNYIWNKNEWENNLLTIGLYLMLPIWICRKKLRYDDMIDRKIMAYKTYHIFAGFRFQPRNADITFSMGKTTRLGRIYEEEMVSKTFALDC